MTSAACEPGGLAPIPRRLWGLPSWLLNNVASRANRLVTDRLGRPGLRTKYAVLAGLDEFGPISQAALGRRLGIDRGDLVSMLNELEDDGLAVRKPDETDRRRNAIGITTDGSSVLHTLDAQVNDAQEALLEPLSTTERQQLNRLLQRLAEHHIAAPR